MSHQRTKRVNHGCPATGLEDNPSLGYSTGLLGASGAEQDEDEGDLVLAVPPTMPTSKKSKPFEASNIRIWMKGYIYCPRRRESFKLQEESIDKTQLTVQIDDDGSKSEPPKSLVETSLGIKRNINLCGVINHISKMG